MTSGVCFKITKQGDSISQNWPWLDNCWRGVLGILGFTYYSVYLGIYLKCFTIKGSSVNK